MGNCGVGFAPVRAADHDALIDLMEGVEDIPGSALSVGMPWGRWESFGEYLDLLDEGRYAVDIAAQVAHGAVRFYVMGERGAANEDATDEDMAAMASSSATPWPPARWVSRPRGPSATRPGRVVRCPAPTHPKRSCWLSPT